MALTAREQQEVDVARSADGLPVVFVHGLWLLAESWDRWRELFAHQGFSTLAPGWPRDPETVAAAKADPQALAGVGLDEITDHLAEVVRALGRPPVIIGHSFGGMLTQKLAGMGLARASVAIDPAPYRGILPLPFSALKVASVALRDPRNRGRAVALTAEQFRYGFANATTEAESTQLHQAHSVAGPGRPLFEAALANLNPRSAARVDLRRADRGPMLVISGERDHTVPPSIARATYKRQLRSSDPTELVEIPGRGHSLTIDAGWQDVAEVALAFLGRHGVTP